MNTRAFLLSWAVVAAALALLVPSANADSLLVVNATADPSQGNILQYDLSTGAPLGGGPLVGSGVGGLNSPAGLTVGPGGNLYVSNGFDSSILEFNAQGVPLGVFVASGAGGLQGPTHLVFGPGGNLYVASYNTSSVLEYNGTTGAFLQALVPTGLGGLLNPEGMAFHDGNLFVASQGSNQVLEYAAATGAYVGAFVSSGAGGLTSPNGLAFGPDGNLYVASQGSDSILSFNGLTGAYLGTFAAGGLGGLSSPADLAFESSGNLLVASGSGEVLSFNSAGGYLGTLVPAGSGGLSAPIGLLVQTSSVPEPGSLTLSLIGIAIAGAVWCLFLLRQSHRASRAPARRRRGWLRDGRRKARMKDEPGGGWGAAFRDHGSGQEFPFTVSRETSLTSIGKRGEKLMTLRTNRNIVASLLLAVGLLATACASRKEGAASGDAELARRGSIEVTAKLVEIPEKAIFDRKQYNYATILKYQVLQVHRGRVKGETIYVAHYNPAKPRSEVADKDVQDVGGNLKSFVAGDVHRMALDELDYEKFTGGILNKYSEEDTDPIYWAVWTDPASG
jgi:DNA-binding beta-propeller fold protein YncE